MIEYTLHMHVSDCDRPEFRDEIPFKEGRCKTREIPIYGKMAKWQNRNFGYENVISVKNPKFIL